MSGFLFLRKKVIKGVQLSPKGFKIGLEILVKGNYDCVSERPIVFRDRASGSSKLGSRTYLDYLLHCASLYRYALHYPRFPLTQLVRFCTVGAMGTLVNLLVLYLLVEFAKIWYMASAVAAFLAAATNNYAWNKIWTFKDETSGKLKVVRQYTTFLTASTMALAVNLAVLYALVQILQTYYLLAQLIGILCAVAINFKLSKSYVFRRGSHRTGNQPR